MQKISSLKLFVLVVLISEMVLNVNSTQLKCDQQTSPLQCVLFKQYPSINDELGCQLCAVALESNQYLDRANKFCNNEKQEVRKCGLISFTYLLASQKFIQAFNTEYEIFYHEPFNHEQRISNILRKHNVRQALIGWLENVIETSKIEIFLQKAIVYLYLDDIEESLSQLQKYLSLNTGVLDKRTIKLKCRIYEKQGQFNEAFNMLQEYIKKGEQNQQNYHMLQPYLYHLKGNLLMHHLKFDQAIVQFNKASGMFKSTYQQVAFLKGFSFSQYNIGLCYQKLSKHDKAVQKYSELVKNNVKNAEVLNALGNSYIQLAQKANPTKIDEQKLRKGIFYINRAIEDNPSYYLAHYNLGYAYLKSNDFQKAIQKFIESLNIKKTNQAQYALLTAFLLSEKYEQAQKLITEDIIIDDQSIDDILSVFYQYCGSTKNSQFYDKVLSQYQKFIKSANGHYWKAMIQFNRQNYGLAIDNFLQAYDKGYSESYLLFNLAYSFELLNQYEPAVEYYEKSYKKDPRKQTKEKISECKMKIQQKNKSQEL